jgi:hypothetical protein
MAKEPFHPKMRTQVKMNGPTVALSLQLAHVYTNGTEKVGSSVLKNSNPVFLD